MFSLNRAQVIGNVTRDPEVRTTSGGQSVVNFSVATNRTWMDANKQKQEDTQFHNIVAWGKLAEICGQFLGKGRKVYVEGRLQTRDWESQDGQKRRTTEIVAENMIILDRAGAVGRPAGSTDTFGGAQMEPTMSEIAPAPVMDDIKVEDIPF